MEAPGAMSWWDAISTHGKLMRQQQQHLGMLDIHVNQPTDAVSQVLQTCQSKVMPTAPLISCPDKFVGKASQCYGFLLQCSLYYTGQVGINNQQKIAQFLNLLSDKALKWATPVWEKGGESLSSYNCFIKIFCHVFFFTMLQAERKLESTCLRSNKERDVQQIMPLNSTQWQRIEWVGIQSCFSSGSKCRLAHWTGLPWCTDDPWFTFWPGHSPQQPDP